MDRQPLALLLLPLLVTTSSLSVRAAQADAPAVKLSVPDDQNSCLLCHTERDLWEGDSLRLYVDRQVLTRDVHFRAGVRCHDCHGGNPESLEVPEAHDTSAQPPGSKVRPFEKTLDAVWSSCRTCHAQQADAFRHDVHGQSAAGTEEDRSGSAGSLSGPFSCETCHGSQVHALLPVDDDRSPVSVRGQTNLCGGCHEGAASEYRRGVHGQALTRSGLRVTAACADCHGAHGVFPSSDKRSTLHASRVVETCSTCHRLLEEKLRQSVHGAESGGASKTRSGDRLAARAVVSSKPPVCTDCHPRHSPRAESPAFRAQVSATCGRCHPRQTERYGLSMHGELTEVGYVEAATCSDCHGSHDIRPVSDPKSRVARANRFETCGRCHEIKAAGFVDFDPHADHRDPSRNPLLYWVYVTLLTLIFTVFGFFGLHSVLWFVRGWIHVWRHGRPRQRLEPGEAAYVRFPLTHRAAHAVLALSFLGLALTGLPLKYSQQPWAQTLAAALGGFQLTSVWHRVCGLANLGVLLFYAVWLLRRVVEPPSTPRVWLRRLTGPDSLLPTWQDVKDLWHSVRWFFGLGPKPTFDRWTYWEKYDFWGAAGDIVVIGTTGLMLWFPNFFCSFLPGEALNVAKVVHSTQALLATGFVFAIHFFNTHLRPEKMPLDRSILTGLVTEEELREERGRLVQRLSEAGRLEELRAEAPHPGAHWAVFAAAAAALATGLALLVGMAASYAGF